MSNAQSQKPVALIQSLFTEAAFGLLSLVALVGFNHGQASSFAFGATTMAVIVLLLVIGAWPTGDLFWQRLYIEVGNSHLQNKWLKRYHRAGWISCILLVVFALLWTGTVDDLDMLRPFSLLVFAQGLLTLFCAAMVFVSAIKVKAWRSWLIPLGSSFQALFLGGSILTFIATCFGRYQIVQVIITLIMGLGWVIVKIIEWRRFERLSQQNPTLHLDAAHKARNNTWRKRFYSAMLLAALMSLACELSPWFSLLVIPLAFVAAYYERRLYFAATKPMATS